MKYKRTLFSALPIIISAFVIAWCGFYLLVGANSVFAMQTLKAQETEISAHLNKVETERLALEDRVIRLRPGSLDWDLVEEEAQAKLGPLKDGVVALPM